MNQSDRVFIDSNVPMYAVGREHAYKAPSVAVLERAARGDFEAVTSSEVHQEILHRFLALRLPTQARQISEHFHGAVPAVLPVTIDDVARARTLSITYPNLPARDLIHVAVMLNSGVTSILSADRHFDTVAEILRIDPITAWGKL